MLRALIQRSGEPLSKKEILDRVFSDEQDVQPDAVEVLVHRLRKRLDGRRSASAPCAGSATCSKPRHRPDAS